MRIVVISSSVFSVPLANYGGLEHIAWLQASGLAQRGHKVSLVAPVGSTCPGCEVIQCLPPGFPEEAMWRGCTWKNANGEDVAWPGYWQKMIEINDKEGDFCVIDNSWNKWIYQLKAEGKLNGCRILSVMHAPVNTMIGSPPPVDKPGIVCISNDQKMQYEAMFSPAKARTAYNGSDPSIYRPIGVPRTDRFLFLARFSTIKGPDLAIEVCKKAGVGLDLIGDTTITNEPELLKRCQDMADGKQIRILGNVSRGETVYYYSRALALLHPNMRFREPFGLGPVEAQLCGTPVVGWNFGALPETVKHGETGWIVESVEELLDRVKRITSEGIPDTMRERCRQWAENFSVDRMIDGYEKLCNEALITGGW